MEHGEVYSLLFDEQQAIKAQMAANHKETIDKLSVITTNTAVLKAEHDSTKEIVKSHSKDIAMLSRLVFIAVGAVAIIELFVKVAK